MGIRLTQDDIEIIKLIQKYIAVESPIEYTNNQNIKRRPQVSIRWKSKQMYSDLQKLDFCIDKTHTDSAVFQQIPEDLKRHFIRGFCDGDGCIIHNLNKNNYFKNSIIFSNGSKQILDDINSWLKENNICIKGYVKNHNTYYVLNYETVKDAVNLAKLMYENSSIYLKRKHDKAFAMIKYRTNTELTEKTKRILVV